MAAMTARAKAAGAEAIVGEIETETEAATETEEAIGATGPGAKAVGEEDGALRPQTTSGAKRLCPLGSAVEEDDQHLRR